MGPALRDVGANPEIIYGCWGAPDLEIMQETEGRLGPRRLQLGSAR